MIIYKDHFACSGAALELVARPQNSRSRIHAGRLAEGAEPKYMEAGGLLTRPISSYQPPLCIMDHPRSTHLAYRAFSPDRIHLILVRRLRLQLLLELSSFCMTELLELESAHYSRRRASCGGFF